MLIGVRVDLDVVSRKIQLKCAAEMVAVQLSLSNGMKFVFCTCYRVGTLGIPNHDRVIEALRPILCKKKPPKLFLIGDFNLPNVSWDNNSSSVPIEQTFVDSFNELGLKQCINGPTHVKGNVLDDPVQIRCDIAKITKSDFWL